MKAQWAGTQRGASRKARWASQELSHSHPGNIGKGGSYMARESPRIQGLNCRAVSKRSMAVSG
jgi:hypothetical protein